MFWGKCIPFWIWKSRRAFNFDDWFETLSVIPNEEQSNNCNGIVLPTEEVTKKGRRRTSSFHHCIFHLQKQLRATPQWRSRIGMCRLQRHDLRHKHSFQELCQNKKSGRHEMHPTPVPLRIPNHCSRFNLLSIDLRFRTATFPRRRTTVPSSDGPRWILCSCQVISKGPKQESGVRYFPIQVELHRQDSITYTSVEWMYSFTYSGQMAGTSLTLCTPNHKFY